MKTRIHPVTGEQLRRGVRPMTLEAGPVRETVMVGGSYPESEGDAIHTGADLAAFEVAWKRIRAA